MTFIATAETQEAYDIAHGTVRVYGPDYTHDASHVWDPYHGEMPPGIWLSPDGNWRTIFLPGEEESCGRNFCYCPFCKGLRAKAEPEPTPAERLAVVICELMEDVSELRERLDGRKPRNQEHVREERAQRWERVLAAVEAALGEKRNG